MSITSSSASATLWLLPLFSPYSCSCLLLPAHSYSPSSPASLWPFPGFVRCPTYAPLLEPRIASRARRHHVACAVYKFAEQSSVSGSNENEWGNGRSRSRDSGSGRKVKVWNEAALHWGSRFGAWPRLCFFVASCLESARTRLCVHLNKRGVFSSCKSTKAIKGHSRFPSRDTALCLLLACLLPVYIPTPATSKPLPAVTALLAPPLPAPAPSTPPLLLPLLLPSQSCWHRFVWRFHCAN